MEGRPTPTTSGSNVRRPQDYPPHYFDDSIDAAEAVLEASVLSGNSNNNVRPRTVYFADESNVAIQDIYSQSQDSEPFDVIRLDRSPPSPSTDFRRTPNHIQAWDTDESFPIKEIERIKKKTKRLRQQRADPETTDVDEPDAADDGFTELPPESFVPVKSIRHSARPAVPPRPTPYHRVQPQPWSRDLQRTTSDSQAGDSLDEILNASSQSSLQQQQPSHDNPQKEVSQCLDPNQVTLQFTVQNSRSSEDDDYPDEVSLGSQAIEQEDFMMRDPSLTQAQTNDSSDHSAFVEMGGNPFEDPPFNSVADSDVHSHHHPFINVHDASTTTTPLTTTTDNTPADTVDASMTQLHELCGEAASPDDIAWRNALFLLSTQPELARVADSDNHWTPLHICCMGSLPAPTYMLHALLFVYPTAVRMPDVGGRLPLHLVAATSADVEMLELLTREYPEALVTVDQQGFTPLHLLLRNVSVELTVERARVLLGLSSACHGHDAVGEGSGPTRLRNTSGNVLQRRGEHLDLPPDEVNRWLRKPKPVTVFHRPMVVDHETTFNTFPLDVQLALKKLSKWKRAQRDATDDTELMDSYCSGQTDPCQNPAAITAPKTNQLPVHVVIRRALLYRTALRDEKVYRRDDCGDNENGTDSEEDDMSDQEISSSPRLLRPSVPHPFDVLRLVVSSFPEGLVHRDSDGYTPLLLTMLDQEYVPELEIVELLLGNRTAGAYATLPSWSDDLPMHQSYNKSFINPAMIPSAVSGQLPLHLASEELLSEYPIIKAIRDNYPAAVHVQDSSGRTPLHTALKSYRRLPIEPRVFAKLYSDRVAHVRDDQGRIPLDLLLESVHSIPTKMPLDFDHDESEDASTIYQKFVVASFRGMKRTANPSQAYMMLEKLRALPSWLRQHVCTSAFVQELLITDLSSPWKCAFVILDGLVLLVLITVFRLQMEQYIQSLYTGVLVAKWYTYVVYLAATVRVILNVSFWILLVKVGEFQHLCLFNLPTWIDTCAMLLAIVTSVLLYGSETEEKLLSMGTATTGMLWLSLLSFLSTWFYGMAIFAGVLRNVASYLLWPAIIVCSTCIAFAQMFYTQLQLDCEESVGVTTVCSVRDSYRVVYMLARGESLASTQSYETLSSDAIVLTTLFLLIAALFCVGLLVSLFVVASRLDFEKLAAIYYWEPKLAAYFSASEIGFVQKRSTWAALDAKLGIIWDQFFLIILGGERTQRKKWDLKRNHQPLKAIAWLLLALVAVPAWLILGVLTLGLLWPPQVRRALFRPLQFHRHAKRRLDHSATTIPTIRQEISQLKALTFYRSDETERMIQELAEVVNSLVKDK